MDRRPKPLHEVENRDDCCNAVPRLRRCCGALWADVVGAELAEWVVVVALVLGTGFAIYNHVLTSQLSHTVDTVGNNILDAASGKLGGT